jgi:RNase P subunit RPR2
MPEITFTPLPSLKSKLKRDIPAHVSQKLSYEWKVLHKVSLSSPQVRLGISRSFTQAVEEYSVELPDAIARKFCPFCSTFLMPPDTAQLRLRSVSKNSKRNKKRPLEMRSKNDLIITCLTCGRVASRLPGFDRNKGSKKDELALKEITDSESIKLSKPPSASKRFSFLDKLDNRRLSAPGRLDNTNFIAFTDSERADDVQKRATPNSKRPYDQISGSGAAYNKPTKPTNIGSKPAPPPATSGIDLDALERQNKKQRKKSLPGAGMFGQRIMAVAPVVQAQVSRAPPPPASSLSALQSVFSLKK